MNYNELTNQGNVKWSQVESGGIRLDVDPLASLTLAAVDAGVVREGGTRIVARGSNANGEYVRFADGTQICWVADRAWTTNANGNDTWPFPAAFVALPACWGLSLSPAYDVREFRSSSNITSMRVKAVNPSGNNYSSQPVTAHLFAIGRWK